MFRTTACCKVLRGLVSPDVIRAGVGAVAGVGTVVGGAAVAGVVAAGVGLTGTLPAACSISAAIILPWGPLP